MSFVSTVSSVRVVSNVSARGVNKVKLRKKKVLYFQIIKNPEIIKKSSSSSVDNINIIITLSGIVAHFAG